MFSGILSRKHAFGRLQSNMYIVMAKELQI